MKQRKSGIQARRPRPKHRLTALLRDQVTPAVLGYKLHRASLTPKREYVDLTAPGDYGADPLEGGVFRMVPSGDIVDESERYRRLRQ